MDVDGLGGLLLHAFGFRARQVQLSHGTIGGTFAVFYSRVECCSHVAPMTHLEIAGTSFDRSFWCVGVGGADSDVISSDKCLVFLIDTVQGVISPSFRFVI